MFGIGMTELMVLFVVGLVVLGPKRLPSLARSLGRTLAEFRHASNDLRRDFMDVADNVNANDTDPNRAIEGANEDAATSAPPDASAAIKPDASAAKEPDVSSAIKPDAASATTSEASKDLSVEAPTACDPHADEDPETHGG
jgi:sec-independent protein translocase protein TatB